MLNSLRTILRHNTRKNFIRDIILVTSITTISVLILFAVFGNTLTRGVADAHLNGLTESIDTKLSSSAAILNNISEFAVEFEKLELDDPASIDKLENQLVPFMVLMPQIRTLRIISPDGHEFLLGRNQSSGSLEKGVGLPASPDKVVITWKSLNGNGSDETRTEEREPSRNKPWYMTALEDQAGQKIHWSTEEISQKGKYAGITGSFRIGTSGKILAFEFESRIFLENVQEIMADRDGKIFLLAGNDMALTLFSTAEKSDPGSFSWFNPLQAASDPLIRYCVSLFRSGEISTEDSSKIVFEQDSYWVAFLPLATLNSEITLGVVLNENEFSGDLQIWKLFFRIGSLIAILAGLFWAAMMVRKYSARIREAPPSLITSNDFENDLQSLINRGENETLEFKSTLRMNLKSGKAGKEIEIAVLKTVAAFLNTNGGILLIGVNDSGEITGMEPDEFENDDHCKLHFKNLIKQHIGLEFSDSIHFELHKIEGKTLGVVECSATGEPVFLYQRDKEEFYIRSGPASVSLPISKALAYLNN